MTTTYENSGRLGSAFLAAMGLDAKDVLSVTLHCEAGTLPTVTLKKAVRQGHAEQAKHLLEQYRVEFVGSTPLASLDESVSLTSQIHTTHRPVG